MKKTFQPFANDSDSFNIGEFAIENGTDKLSVYGSLDLTRDKAGLQHARALKAVVDAVVQALEQDKALPDHVAPPEKPKQVKNPFA